MTPVPIVDEWAWLDAIIGPVDDDFVSAVEEQPAAQSPPELPETNQARLAASLIH